MAFVAVKGALEGVHANTAIGVKEGFFGVKA
jgi:hypothetical protein